MSASQLGFEQLFELERGLRSSIRADQQKAFEFFPEHLKQYAVYPDVIEASILRLLDFFKARSMERKLEMMRALESSIDTTLFAFNEDEAVRRLCALWEINDSLLRSLVLRWFALLGKSVSCSPNVYYRVGESLLSAIREEHMAAARCLEACLEVSDEAPRIFSVLKDKVLYRAQSSPTGKFRDILGLMCSKYTV